MSEKNQITFYQNGSIEIVDGKGKVSFPYHTHNCFMLGIITSGQMDMTIMNITYRMQPGTIYIIPSNIGMSMQYVTEFSYTSICLKNEIADYMNTFMINTYVVSSLGPCLSFLCHKYKKEQNDAHFVRSIVALLQLKERKGANTENPLILNAISYIAAHAEERCSVEEVAEKMFISKFHFCRIFKKEMGITPKQYILQAKLRVVKEKIWEPDTETRIAEDMAFAAQSHLCSLFKKYMGLSIRDYKQNLTKEK